MNTTDKIKHEQRVRVIALELMTQAGFEQGSITGDILTSSSLRAKAWVQNARKIVKLVEQMEGDDAARYRYLREADPRIEREIDVVDDCMNIICGDELDKMVDAGRK
jgi:hypothetical protein